jgi:hypothetical protein
VDIPILVAHRMTSQIIHNRDSLRIDSSPPRANKVLFSSDCVCNVIYAYNF